MRAAGISVGNVYSLPGMFVFFSKSFFCCFVVEVVKEVPSMHPGYALSICALFQLRSVTVVVETNCCFAASLRLSLPLWSD